MIAKSDAVLVAMLLQGKCFLIDPINRIGGWAGQVEASLGKWAAMGNPEMQAIGSWAEQV